MKIFLTFAMILFLFGCADSHQLVRLGGNSTKLDPGGKVYIAVPRDGRYGQTIYQGSGQNTAQMILLAFAEYVNKIESGYESQEFEVALDSAQKVGAKYLVIPTILEWEDRATEWSGIPDKASIKVSVVDVATASILDSVIIKGKSGLATFGGDHPQDLLPKPIGEYVRSLY